MGRVALVVGLVGLGLVGKSRGAVAGECMPQLLLPQIVTPAGAEVPADGGVLVATARLQSPALGPVVGPKAKLRFVDGKKSRAAVARTLAPGLVVFSGTGTRLVDGMTARKGTLLAVTRPATAAPLLAAPTVTAAVLWHGGSRHPSTSLQVTLPTAPTASAILVVLDAEGAGTRSWGFAHVGDARVAVYAVGECLAAPDGSRASVPGDKIRLAWVDQAGRMSAPSAVIEVSTPPVDPTRAPPP